MRGNTTRIKLLKGVVNRAFNPLFQYDYGQKLVFENTDLPLAYEVHFSNSEYAKSKVQIGNSEGVDIPDEYLLTGEPVYVWVFLHEGQDDGETEYRGMIPVIARPESTDIPITPVEQNVITQTIAALNEAVEMSNTNVEHYPRIIDDYWYVWDARNGEYANTGVDATGEYGPYYTPHISHDGVISWTNNGDLPNPESVNIVQDLDLARMTDLPTKVSDLVDDSGHYTKPTDGIPFSDMTEGVVLTIANKADISMIGSSNGIAELDENGKVPAEQLPSYVDDVVEYPTYSDFPDPGESGKLYVDIANSEVYRWTGSIYVSVSEAGQNHAPKNNPVFTGSISLGRKNNTTVGGRSSAIGLEVEASGANAHAEGNNTRATSTSAHAEGSNTRASATYAHAEGQSTEATNVAAHAEGTQTRANGMNSHAEGNGSNANGMNAHAEGNGSLATAANSHAEGNATASSGENSHAEGRLSESSGVASHAEGYATIASGMYSHAQGEATKANHKDQTVLGAFNTEDPSTEASTERGNYIEIVGNGTADNSRSNARALDWQGNEYLKGDLYVQCGENSQNGTKVATIDDIDNNRIHDLLQMENIPDTTQTIAYNYITGDIQSITHTDNSNQVVRTDLFTFGTNTITEERTLNNGRKLTITTNTETLVTTVAYAVA